MAATREATMGAIPRARATTPCAMTEPNWAMAIAALPAMRTINQVLERTRIRCLVGRRGGESRGIGAALLAGLLLAALSLLRRETPRLLPWLILLATGVALAWLLLNKPG